MGTEGDRSCENAYEEGITYFGDQVAMVDSVLTQEECAAICSKEADCAFWSHLGSQSECRIWSSDVVRSDSEHSKDWVSGKSFDQEPRKKTVLTKNQEKNGLDQ